MMEKVTNGDQHPLRTIISDSLGHDVHDVHKETDLPRWRKIILFSASLKTSYPIDVRFISDGNGALHIFDKEGQHPGTRILGPGTTTGTIVAGTLHSYEPTPGSHIIIREDNADLFEQEAPDLD